MHYPKPKHFDEKKYYLYYADDYQKFQFGPDPLSTIQKQKKLGQKTSQAKGHDWL